MSKTTNPKILKNPASLILVGEISHTLRGKGNALATGIKIDASESSPLVSGQYKEIPQAQIGLLDYASFISSTNKFRDAQLLDSGIADRTPWNLFGAVSLDAIFCPYNNFMDSGRAGPYMPHWTNPSDENGINALKLNPFNPFNQLDSLSIQKDVWTSGGHNISMALSYNPLDSGNDGKRGYVGFPSGEYPGGTGSPVDLYFEKDFWARRTVERSGIRAVGFKAPMVLTGWGYDLNGNPVPADTGDATKFHPDASWDLHLWKSGPVDLRWDQTRGVWTGGNTTKVYLVKLTNLSTPPSFSFEVDRSNSRDQYTRNAPTIAGDFNSSGLIYDPEYIAYHNNANNFGYYERLDYDGLEYPYYEAFIIRETVDSPVTDASYYNTWDYDCNDCGHISNPCVTNATAHSGSSIGKKVLIENPLRQSFDVGDLAFTIDTGRKQKVNTGFFVGGSGVDASGVINTDGSGYATFTVTNAGRDYITGGFGILSTGCKICSNILLSFTEAGQLSGATLFPSSGFPPNQTCGLTIYPNNATVETETLPIHWVTQSEFKSQQVVTHVECDNGVLQTCTMKVQTQGFKTCEWCGEDTALINN